MISFISFLLASAFSLALIWLLRASDEKLARTARTNRIEIPSSVRTLVSIGVFLPGIVLLAIPQVGVFFSWFGTLTVLGWLIALRRPTAHASREKAR